MRIVEVRIESGELLVVEGVNQEPHEIEHKALECPKAFSQEETVETL